ncbi:MAG: TonB-dependent receptor [Flavobacteriales bacterium]|nr:TonB-dependent receptor [Crocinitomicaceae bacterium]NBX80826.1 TonB-dependent receptor [Flavobacteriales bacterium]NCA20236.1 TonB-dependent receptor [Crocinitomicaceae bacterium]
MKKSILVGLGIGISSISFSQNRQAQGKVVDEVEGRPIAGATVEYGQNKKSVTDENGRFFFDCQIAQVVKVAATDYVNGSGTVKNCDDILLITMKPTVMKNLNEVEITATSNTQKEMLYQPSSIAKLGVTEIKRGNGLFMDDAINTNIPGVTMQRRTVSAGQTFNIRGYGNGARGTNGVNSNFDSQGSKVYLNGIPITDAEGITLMDDIDFGSIGGVEVLKGPSGSLYGLAIAGVVNLKTVKPQAGKISIGQDAMFGSYGLQRYTTTLQIGTARSSLLVNYGKQKYDGFMQHTASTKDFVNVFGTYEANEKQSMNVYFGYSNSYDERNGELTAGQYDTLDYSGNPAYVKNNAHSNVISARAGFGHTYKFTKNFSNTTSVFATGISSNVSSAGGWTDKLPVNYGIRSTFDYNRKLGDKFNLSGVTGIEAQQQNAQTIGYNMVKDSLNPTGYNIIGSMRSNTYAISKTASYFTEWTLAMPYEISLAAGVGISNMAIELNDRFYVASNNSANPNTLHKPTHYSKSYNGLVSPHVAINKVINKQISVYASYGMGYKAPVSSYFYIPLTGQLNTNLKPEIGTQYEIGTKGTLLNNKLSYQVALFNAIYTNKMTVVAVPNAANTATSYTYVANGGTQNNKGIEAVVKYTIINSETGFVKSLTPFVNVAYSNFKYEDFKYQQLNSAKTDVVEVDYSGKVVAGVPPITFNAGVDFATNFGLYANATYSYRDKVYYTSDNLNQADAFSLVNAKIGYSKTFFKHLSLDAYFGANNITGTQYYQMLFVNQVPDAYLPGPNKINFFGGVNLKYNF